MILTLTNIISYHNELFIVIVTQLSDVQMFGFLGKKEELFEMKDTMDKQ